MRYLRLSLALLLLLRALDLQTGRPAGPTQAHGAGAAGWGRAVPAALGAARARAALAPHRTRSRPAIPAVARTPGVVQAASAVPQTGRAVVKLGYARAQHAGDTNILAIGWNDTTAGIKAVTDSAGDTYRVAAPLRRGDGLSQAIYYAGNIAPARRNTITVVFTKPARFVDLRALEYRGLSRNHPLDVAAGATGTGALADSGRARTHAARELLIGAGMTGTRFTGTGSGYRRRILTRPDGDIVEDRYAAAPGTYRATAPLRAGGWLMQLVTFRSS